MANLGLDAYGPARRAGGRGAADIERAAGASRAPALLRDQAGPTSRREPPYPSAVTYPTGNAFPTGLAETPG